VQVPVVRAGEGEDVGHARLGGVVAGHSTALPDGVCRGEPQS
jgi:hypothetical protein